MNKKTPIKEKGKSQTYAHKENSNQLSLQTPHALTLFKITKKNLIKTTRFRVGVNNAGRVASLDLDN